MSALRPRSPQIPATASGRAVPPDSKWGRNAARWFHRLVKLHPNAAGLGGRGGVFVTWPLVSYESPDGVALFLTDRLELLVANPRAKREGITPVPVQPPGFSAARQRLE